MKLLEIVDTRGSTTAVYIATTNLISIMGFNFDVLVHFIVMKPITSHKTKLQKNKSQQEVSFSILYKEHQFIT